MEPGTEQSRIVGRISSGGSAVVTVMAVVTPRAADSDHVVEFAPKFLARFCDVLEPVLQIRRGVEAAEIEISRPVSEPAPHLHQRVTHAAGPQEVADAQTFQCQAAGELVSADRNDIETGLPVALIGVPCRLRGVRSTSIFEPSSRSRTRI
jgi:hypothetical protein